MFNITHIANLARIKLTSEEKERFQKDLGAILDFAGKLKEVDTSKIEPMSHAAGLENVMRKDESRIKNHESRIKKLMDLVPENKDGYVKVRKVL